MISATADQPYSTEEYATLLAELAELDAAIAQGAEGRVTTAVYDVTGRPPKSLSEFARDNARAWLS